MREDEMQLARGTAGAPVLEAGPAAGAGADQAAGDPSGSRQASADGLPKGTQLVPMADEHLAAIAAIERACFAEPWSEAALAAELGREESYFVAAVHGGVPVGYAGMQTVLDEGYVANIAVCPTARRQGLGRALTCALLTEGRRRQLRFLTLEVRPSNTAACTLYRQLGFAEVGRRRRFYRMPDEDALLMTYFYPTPPTTKEGDAI